MPNYGLDGPAITTFDKCSPEMIRAIRSYFQQWGKHHMTKPDMLRDWKLEEHVDNMVFKTWASDEPILTPVFRLPVIQDSYVRVGVFKETLPSHGTTVTIIAAGLENDVVGYSGRYRDPNPPPERRVGQPAFLRAKMDSLQQSIVHEFFDKQGKPVPVSFIDFGTENNMPSEAKLCQAYKTADTAWAKACDTWNSQLCVYLCRRKIFDLSHTYPWNPANDGQRSYSEDNFIVAPRICTRIPSILDRHRAIGVFIDDQETRGQEGLAVFTGPVSRGIDTHESNANACVKQEKW
ncbi:hypothetical protein PFICI_11629 [Pestalotiopsis fici W106-1]|uniref:Uncharacterized protein n=1 Tax=Pestalotiopsis fici (strain W106-1 / CGMCC3.15140) TaxID=1229662 RepID=W3WSZ1_PESFW|nr:uncharacterized protein PFICI_11629 [Pestalotiopsis fici W106-1]ETS76242.1 hypothetical protein PFICI_11629 [Pestalotiopsis fici W106-1]